MADYSVKIKGSEDVEATIRNHPRAMEAARAIAIAVAKVRLGEVSEVWRGKTRVMAFQGHEARTVKVQRAR